MIIRSDLIVAEYHIKPYKEKRVYIFDFLPFIVDIFRIAILRKMQGLKDIVTGTSKTFIYSAGGAGLVQGSVAASIPVLQSTFGTVVYGVGTIQAPWLGSVASFAATPLVGFVIPAGVVGAAGYVVYTGGKWYFKSRED